jgi:hypothetical protein
MTQHAGYDDDQRARERDRVTQELTGRLQARGVEVRSSDSSDDVTSMEEAVERFEDRVRALGGDLMVDVPPVGHHGQPDEARFQLPLRRDGETAERFTSRVAAATNNLGAHRAD